MVWYDVDATNALQRAETILDRIRQLELPSPTDGSRVPITASAGLAYVAPDARASSQDVLRRADQLLYAAKFAGRDQMITTTVDGTSRS